MGLNKTGLASVYGSILLMVERLFRFFRKCGVVLHFFLLVPITAGFTILCVLVLTASYSYAVASGFLDWMAPSQELRRLRRCSSGTAKRMLYLLFRQFQEH